MTEAELRLEAAKCARWLIQIAERAMPDTYLATDPRVKHARRLLNKLRNEPRCADCGHKHTQHDDLGRCNKAPTGCSCRGWEAP